MFIKSKRRCLFFFKAANTCVFLNAVSSQPSWFNGHRFRVWFKPALMAASGSCTDDNPKPSPTYERRWLARGFSDRSKPQHICESLDENLTWLAIHGTPTCAMCTELQQSGMAKRGPPWFPMRHPLCAVPFFCYSLTSEPAGPARGDGYRTASNTKKITGDGSKRMPVTSPAHMLLSAGTL